MSLLLLISINYGQFLSYVVDHNFLYFFIFLYFTNHIGTLHPSSSDCLAKPLSQCTLGKDREYKRNSGLSGYYYNNTWKSLKCKTLTYSKHTKDMLQCLRNKTVYFLGDSTIRQWFTFIIEKFEGHKIEQKVQHHVSYKLGEDSWRNDEHNLSMHYHHQGFPVRIQSVPTFDIHYVANMIDSIPVQGSDTVLFICVGVHFTIANLEFFRNRLVSIKNAINRLHPGIRVIVKLINTRTAQSTEQSNWYLEELNSMLLEELSDLPNVAVVDVWSMTTGHPRYGWETHPKDNVLENELAVAFSYFCP